MQIKIKNFFKKFFAPIVVSQILSYLERDPEKNLLKMLNWAKRITFSSQHKSQIDFLIKIFQNGHPSLGLVKKLFNQIHPNCRRSLVNNLFIKQALLGKAKRMDYLKKHGLYPPFFMVISPTMRCNLHCYGCYAGEYAKESDLPLGLFRRVLKEGQELGMHFLTISGGEPFVYEGIWEIFEEFQGISFLVYTNGTFIDKEVADCLARLGNVAPAISVEGFEEETDRRRGKGTWKKIMEAMDSLNKVGCLFGFSATYTRENTEILASEKFIDLMIEKGCSFGWFFHYIPIGRKPTLELMPHPEQRDKMRRFALWVRKTKPIFVADFWNDGALSLGCMAGGKMYLHILNSGDVSPCVFVPFGVGNIKEKSLVEILNCPFFKGVREAQPFSENHLRPCMIIDHPHKLREFCQKYNAYPLYPDALRLLGELAPSLEQNAQDYGKLAEKAWNSPEYNWAKDHNLL